jgi:cadmium resistance protein CadD (predicted permease)
VLELCANDAGALRLVARAHAWVDRLFEGPTTIAVLVTGSLLLARMWPAPPTQLIHAGLGMVPVIVNLICMKWVLARSNENDEARARELTRKVKLSGLAIPVAAVAFVVAAGY